PASPSDARPETGRTAGPGNSVGVARRRSVGNALPGDGTDARTGIPGLGAACVVFARRRESSRHLASGSGVIGAGPYRRLAARPARLGEASTLERGSRALEERPETRTGSRLASCGHRTRRVAGLAVAG